MTGCRIVSLTFPPRRVPNRTNAPFVLTAACGWTTPVAQGVEWERHPARAEWERHACLPAVKVTA